MPAELIDDPLGITFVSTARRCTASVYIGTTCNPQLAREMLIGLSNLVHPHGPIDELKTFQQYVTAIRRFVAELAERGHSGGAADLTRPRLAEYWMGASNAREYKTRRMVAALDRATSVLSPDVRALVGGRHFNPQRRRDKRPSLPYTESEWQRLQEACRAIIRATFAEHRAALAAAERGRDPGEHGWSFDNLCWLLRHRGPVTWTAFDREYGSVVSKTCLTLLPRACTALFIDTNVALAYRLLLGTYIGVVPDGIDALGVADLDWAGDATMLRYLKGRTTSESVTLNRRSVRLLEQWLEHSAPTRALAPPDARADLWTRYVPGRYDDVVTAPFTTGQVAEWAQRGHPALTDAGLALVSNDGGPLRLDRRRIRTTFTSLRDRASWFGSTRATVDPNHTPAIEGDSYLTSTTPAQRDAVETIIENSQADLLRKAQPPIVLSTAATAELTERLPDAIRAMALDDPTITELVSTTNRDVFVGPCRPISCPACTDRPASRARPGRGCACSARWRSSRPGTR
jgi:hypothetical protein